MLTSRREDCIGFASSRHRLAYIVGDTTTGRTPFQRFGQLCRGLIALRYLYYPCLGQIQEVDYLVLALRLPKLNFEVHRCFY